MFPADLPAPLPLTVPPASLSPEVRPYFHSEQKQMNHNTQTNSSVEHGIVIIIREADDYSAP